MSVYKYSNHSISVNIFVLSIFKVRLKNRQKEVDTCQIILTYSHRNWKHCLVIIYYSIHKIS